MPSSLAPSTETSRPSTVPVITIFALTVTSLSNSSILASNVLPSTVRTCKVLFALYHSMSSTPATSTSAAAVIRPSSSTVNVGICEAEPYEPAVTAVLASSAVMLIVPFVRSVRVVLPEPVTLPERFTSI